MGDLLTVIQNDPEVPLGAFAGYLAEENIPFRLLRPYAGEPVPGGDPVSAVIVLGGAMGVHDGEKFPFLAEVKAFIGECVRGGIPFLGICLGGQLLADVLEGEVTPNACGEKGTLTVRLSPEGKADPLFAGVAEELVTFQWHNDCFALPAGAVALASSAACPGQAFRFGTNAYGLQFHPEVDPAIVKLWAEEAGSSSASADSFVTEFIAREEEYRRVARRIVRNFINLTRIR